MFGLSKSQKESGPAQTSAPGELTLHTELIGELELEHEELLKQLEELSKILSSAQLSNFSKKLREFKIEFQSHLMKENLKLYTYLKVNLIHKSEERETMARMRRGMNDVNTCAKSFFEKYLEGTLDSENASNCEIELSELTHLLRSRFEKEESVLFPLYR